MGDEPDIRAELERLRSLTVGELRAEWSRRWGEPCRSWNKPHLIRRCAWKLAYPEGLSPETIARAREIAAVSPVRLHATRAFADEVRHAMEAPPPPKRDPRLPMPGTTLARRFRGETVEVRVLERGFEYGGEWYPTLSAVASKITGSHINGFRFWRLGPKEKQA